MRPSDFDARQLARGARVEMEHTSSRAVAREIAMDHLVEDPAYYKKLAKFHLDDVATPAPLTLRDYAFIGALALGGLWALSAKLQRQ